MAICIVLGIQKSDILSETFSQSWIQVAVFGFASYLIGFGIAPISYAITNKAASLVEYGPAVIRRRIELQSLEDTVQQALRSSLAGDHLLADCKRRIRIQNRYLIPHLDNYEQEINLLGMLPPALLVFGIVMVLIPNLNLLLLYRVTIGLVCLLLAISLAIRLPTLRISEKRECYEFVLLLINRNLE